MTRKDRHNNSEAKAIAEDMPRNDDAAYLSAIGDTVRRARSGRGMTRKALAQASGVSERYLAELETGTGNASLIVLRKIARAIGVDVAALVGPADDRSPELETLIGRLEALGPDELAEVSRYVAARFAVSRQQPRRHIGLIGLRGAGKTTLGRALAEKRGLRFIELDREIERTAGMEIAEIFALQGQAGFRKLELDCLKAVVDSEAGSVIATGGSLVTSPKAFSLLRERCVVVWLKATPAEHMERVLAQGDMRPMADNPLAMEDLKSILDSRAALYSRADVTLDTSRFDVATAVAELSRLAEGAGATSSR